MTGRRAARARAAATGGPARGRLASRWRGGPFGVRDFRLLSLGQLTSTVGDYCYAVALPWMVLSARGGAVLLGTVLACYGVPRAVLIPAGGVLADRLGARRVMLASDAIRCALVAALAALAARHADSLALLGPVAALLGAGEGAFLPASFSVMPAILRRESLAAGNALSTATTQAGSLAGSALGGLLVTMAGPAAGFAADSASFAVSAITLALMRVRPRAATRTLAGATAADGMPATERAAREPAAEPAGAWTLLRTSRLLQVILAVCVMANLSSGGTFEVALPALARERFGAAGYGALLASLGLGSLIGTLAAGRSGSLRRPAVVAFSAFAAEGALLAAVPFLGLAAAAGIIAAFGVGNGFGNVVTITLLQRWAPRRLLGRVMSLVMLAAIGSFPASVAVAGVLVRHLGPAPFFPICGTVLALTALAGLSQRQVRDLGAAPRRAGHGDPQAEPPAGQAAVVVR